MQLLLPAYEMQDTDDRKIHEILLRHKKEENFTFATVWMDLENIMLSEVSQSKKNKYHMISVICGI